VTMQLSRMMYVGFLLLMASVLNNISVVAFGTECSFPEPDKAFTNAAYEGRWFEIGKIQTSGGAFFERNCVCTELQIKISNSPNLGDGIADNDCRYKTTDGRWTNATGALSEEDPNVPGRWLETIGQGSPVNYTVIALGSDFAVEYDCGTSLGITNYCIHVMSRTSTMDSDQFDELMQLANAMGLNPQNLPIIMTKQDGC